METGDCLNTAFVETTLNDSMLAEVGDLDLTIVDEDIRQNFRCSTPVVDEHGENPAFEVTCNVDIIEDSKVADICDALTEIKVTSK